jgi:hypothetical protein
MATPDTPPIYAAMDSKPKPREIKALGMFERLPYLAARRHA